MKRSEVESKYKWNLDSIVPQGKWDELYAWLKSSKDTVALYRGSLGTPKTLLECLQKTDEISIKLENLYVYAKMYQDEDTANSAAQSMTGKAMTLAAEISEAQSFITPEITAAYGAEGLKKLSEQAEFNDYSYMLSELARNAKRVLSDKEERIIAMSSNVANGYQNAFTMFDNADVAFCDVTDENGNAVKMSHGTYSELLMCENRRVRKDAYKSMFEAYKGMINTVGALYLGNVQKDIFYSRLRGYDTSLAHAMDAENVDKKVYDNLLAAVTGGTKKLQEYLEVRKQRLGVEKLEMYDLHVPVVKNADLKLDYEAAFALVKEALSVLGGDYTALLQKAHDEGWIDVCETENKRSGAYSWGTYTSHPYVLLNYKQTTHDVFTIAHELGHAIHSYKSNAAQPFAKAGYEIFVAEIASTVNEMLLLRYLTAQGKADKAYLLSYLADMFRTTFFRQTMFAEFEKQAHEMVEGSGTATPQELCQAYGELNSKYYGKDITDELITYEWARIPHFYTSFYVYKYATGIVSAAAISEDIFSGKKGALEGYMKFLSLGGSMPPLDILKVAGVDLTSAEPFEKALALFGNAVDELKKL